MFILHVFFCLILTIISYVDDSLILKTQDGITSVNVSELASIRIPQSIINITDTDDISLAFTLYNQAVLFPIRGSPPNTVVGSSVISARVGGVTDGTKLPQPVIINLALKRTAVSG